MSVFIGGFTGQAHLKNIKIFSINRFHNFLNTPSAYYQRVAYYHLNDKLKKSRLKGSPSHPLFLSPPVPE